MNVRKSISLITVYILLTISLLSAQPVSAQPSTSKHWREAPELKCDCTLDRVKPIRYGSAEPEVAGMEIKAFDPVDYTTGDMFATGKLVVRADESVVREFEKIPLSWNRKEKAFEFDLDQFLVRVSGLPVYPRVVVFKAEKLTSPQKTRQAPIKTGVPAPKKPSN